MKRTKKNTRTKLTMIFLTLATMSGCLVSSLHPFYKEKDKIYEESLEGSWIDGDSCIWTIDPNIRSAGFMSGKTYHDSSYVISFFEDEESAPSILRGTLFTLDGVNYVDFFPDPNEDHHTADLTAWHHVPVHTLARVQYCGDSIMLYWYGDEWLNELFEENRIRIKHEEVEAFDYDRHLLTADTDELQKFIKKYINDPRTAEDIEAIFAQGSTDAQNELGLFLKLKPYDGPLPGRSD